MFVAVCRLELHISAAQSLKDKRRVVQSVITRVRHQFGVSIAEVEALENRDLAVLAVAVVSNDAIHAREVVERVVRFLDHVRMDADLGAVEFDVLSAF